MKRQATIRREKEPECIMQPGAAATTVRFMYVYINVQSRNVCTSFTAKENVRLHSSEVLTAPPTWNISLSLSF